MKVSIITVVYNNEKTIASCIESVKNQTYKNIEHIIIDGQSTDDTLKIVNRYSDSIARIVSEPDNGIYDAMNKGIAMATGDIVACLNSDDLYPSEDTIERVVKEFKDTGCDATFGDVVYVKPENLNKVIRIHRVSPFKPGAFSKGWHPIHITFFSKREFFEKYGNFNTEFKISADFDLILRFIEFHRIKTSYIPEVIGKMRLGGASNRSIDNILSGNRDVRRAFETYNIKYPIFYTQKRLIRKVFQYRSAKEFLVLIKQIVLFVLRKIFSHR